MVGRILVVNWEPGGRLAKLMGSSCLDLIMNSWEMGGVAYHHWERSYNFTRSNCRVFVFYFYLFFTAPLFVSCRYISHLLILLHSSFLFFSGRILCAAISYKFVFFFFLFDREIIIIERRGGTFCSSYNRDLDTPEI
ncbi:hypothetical protein DFP73DRAFT_273427 [Morchella snyderi]|nr:hypothetical protein DFP73DRAFT_273427 [Morchella snyderi]